MNAVIYARYSSSSQREESIEGQIRDCTAYAERNGYMVIGTYADRAISGTTENRPEFLKMIKDSKTATDKSGSDLDCHGAPNAMGLPILNEVAPFY